MRSTFHLGRVFGIEIGLHYTWLIVFALITWSLAGGYFPALYSQWPSQLYWLLGLVTSLLFFASVLLHELGHSLVSVRLGLPVQGITLFIFGGVARIEREPERPRDDVWITAAGPAVSLALAALFFLLELLGGAAWRAAWGWLAQINLYLGLFNLRPGGPLDGGRLVRAGLWAFWGDRDRAHRAAARGGQILAYLFILLGFAQSLGGGFGSGLWLIALGWFLASSAEGSYRMADTRSTLRGHTVRHLAVHDPVFISPGASLQVLVMDYILGQNRRCVLVGRDGELVGIITLTDVKKVPREEWENESVQRWMTRAPLHTIDVDAPVTDLLDLMARHDLDAVPALAGDRVIGMVTRSDLIRYLHTLKELGMP